MMMQKIPADVFVRNRRLTKVCTTKRNPTQSPDSGQSAGKELETELSRSRQEQESLDRRIKVVQSQLGTVVLHFGREWTGREKTLH